jgi:hypothetical protein
MRIIFWRKKNSIQRLPSENILSITVSELLYRDNEGNQKVIDFQECYQRWLKRELSYQKNNSESSSFPNATSEWKEIGERDALDTPPYIQFYSKQRIQFDFASYEELTAFRMKLWELGKWTTFDLA